MLWSILFVSVASLFGSGVLFEHRRVLTYLGLAGALFEAQWLALTLLRRTALPDASADIVLTVSGVALCAAWALGRRRWSFPYRSNPGSGLRDLWVMSVMGIVLGAAVLVSNANGLRLSEWITHGFYNGDTATFMALIQRSFLEDGLVTENPFSGNGPLEYPTLLHAGVADLFGQANVGMNWFHFLPAMTFIQIFITVPLFFLLWDVTVRAPDDTRERWFGVPRTGIVYALQAGIVLYVLALGWDNYIYPQSHFFLTGIFLAAVALFVRGDRERVRGQILYVACAFIGTIVLLLSNAVTGTALFVLALVFCLSRLLDKKRVPRERMWFGVYAFLFLLLFVVATPGNGSFGFPQFSYTGAEDMTRLALPVTFLAGATVVSLTSLPLLRSFAGALVLLSFVTFFFSTRDIVVANASRFLYHALLVAFPVVLQPVIRLFYIVRRELMYTTHSVVQSVTGWVMVVGVLLLLALPAVASTARAHDNLMYNDRHVVGTAKRETMWHIADEFEPDAVFVANPNAPFAIPMFTGRSVLRTNYWLSEDDEVLRLVERAFEGDGAAQRAVISMGDYLLVTREERERWTAVVETLPIVYDLKAVTVFRLPR